MSKELRLRLSRTDFLKIEEKATNDGISIDEYAKKLLVSQIDRVFLINDYVYHLKK